MLSLPGQGRLVSARLDYYGFPENHHYAHTEAPNQDQTMGVLSKGVVLLRLLQYIHNLLVFKSFDFTIFVPRIVKIQEL